MSSDSLPISLLGFLWLWLPGIWAGPTSSAHLREGKTQLLGVLVETLFLHVSSKYQLRPQTHLAPRLSRLLAPDGGALISQSAGHSVVLPQLLFFKSLFPTCPKLRTVYFLFFNLFCVMLVTIKYIISF